MPRGKKLYSEVNPEAGMYAVICPICYRGFRGRLERTVNRLMLRHTQLTHPGEAEAPPRAQQWRNIGDVGERTNAPHNMTGQASGEYLTKLFERQQQLSL
jgi:hypothetical protein